MKAFLDDRKIDAGTPTLADVLTEGAAMAEEEGRIIVEVSIDGQEVAGDELESPSDTDLGDAEVRLVSADPAALAAQALSDAATQLSQTRERQTQCASLVQVGKITEAMSMMEGCLSDWQMARTVVDTVTQLTNVTAKTADDTIEDLAAKLDELKSALTGQDWATVADLLAYDLDEQVTSWTAMLDEMRATFEG